MTRPSCLLLALVQTGFVMSAVVCWPTFAQAPRIRAGGHVIVDSHPRREILVRNAYTASYDLGCRVPVWVAYEAQPDFLLETEASPVEAVFRDDPQVPEAAKGSEFEGASERGYATVRLVPQRLMGGDRRSVLRGLTTFEQADLTTVLAPMYLESVGNWTTVENWIVRDLVQRNQLRLSIVAGCILGEGVAEKTGVNADICVPPLYFVVVAKQAEAGDGLRAIALLLPHQRGFTDMSVVSVDLIESLTGLDLFSELDDGQESRLEQATGERSWDGPVPPRPGRAIAMRDFSVREESALPRSIRKMEAPPRPAPVPREMPAAEEAPAAPAPPAEPIPRAKAAPAPPAPAEEATPQKKDRRVIVYYGTDRNIEHESIPNEFYGSQSADLTLGTCTVSIPPVHVQGSGGVERPFMELFPEDPEQHVVLQSVQPLGETEFIERLVANLNRADGRQAFVFIHGYNNSFADAARRTAQMAFDLDLEIVPVMYSWPSQSRIASYFYDQSEVDVTVPHLEQFLKLIRDQCRPDKLHIICHSMGSDLFKEVVQKIAVADGSLPIDQIILAAPDIDERVFKEEIAPRIEGVASRVTIYVSQRDAALFFSNLANHAVRLGARAWPDLAAFLKIDQVDVTEVDTSVVGHLYYGDDSAILDDMRGVLRGTSANDRNLYHFSQHYVYPGPPKPIDWDLRQGWEIDNFRRGWGILLDRKVLALIGVLLLFLLVQRWRIRRLTRKLQPRH